MRVAYAQNYQLGGIRPEKAESVMPVSESDQIAAAGAPIELNDGRILHVRFSLRSLKKIEDHYGSLAALQNVVQVDEQGAPVGKAIEPVVKLLSFGLLHEDVSEDDLYDLLDVRRFEDYSKALNTAMVEAFPQAAARAEGKAQQVATVPPNGQTSGMSPPSSSDAQTPSFGT